MPDSTLANPDPEGRSRVEGAANLPVGSPTLTPDQVATFPFPPLPPRRSPNQPPGPAPSQRDPSDYGTGKSRKKNSS